MKAAYPPPRPRTPSEKAAEWFYAPPGSQDAAERRRTRERYQPGEGPGVRGMDQGLRVRGPSGQPRAADGFTILTPRLLAKAQKAAATPPPGISWRPEDPRARRLRESIGACYVCGRAFHAGSFFAKSRAPWRWYCPPHAVLKRIAGFPLQPPPSPLAGALYAG